MLQSRAAAGVMLLALRASDPCPAWPRAVTARYTQPALTTVRQPIQGLGREMTRMLLALINGEPVTSLVLATELIIRDSA